MFTLELQWNPGVKGRISQGWAARWFAVDSDDGSYKYNITKNVMVWGGCKNYLSADKVRLSHISLILKPV